MVEDSGGKGFSYISDPYGRVDGGCRAISVVAREV
jgi:hypothetical protein